MIRIPDDLHNQHLSDVELESALVETQLLADDPATYTAFDNATAEHAHNARFAPPTDFISDYATWADLANAPRAVHEAIAIQLVAAVLNRRGVTIDWDYYKLSLDLWVGVIAESGIGKNTAMGPAWEILEHAAITDLIDKRGFGSKEKLYELLAGSPAHFYVWTELAYHLNKLKSSAFEGASIWLADLYDNFKKPQSEEFRDTDKNITFAVAPRTNILGFSSNDWFFENLQDVDSAGGFFPRWLLFDARGSRNIPKPARRDPRHARTIGDTLTRLLLIPENAQVEFPEGFVETGDVPDSRCPYNVWALTTKPRFVAAHPKLGEIFWGRHQVNILKLAAIYQASMDGTVQVTSEAWDRAVAKAAELETTLFRFLRTGMSKVGYKCQEAAEMVHKGGRTGITQSDLTTVYQDADTRDAIVKYFRDTKVVVFIPGGGVKPKRGPTPDVWVHRDYLPEAGG